MRRLSLCYLLLCAVTAFAQVDTGTITGSVRDSQGAGISSATVTFTETSTNTVSKAQCDPSGDYSSLPLRPGTYNVAVEASGFKKQIRESVAVQVQDRLRLDFDMVVGSVNENVVVTA